MMSTTKSQSQDLLLAPGPSTGLAFFTDLAKRLAEAM